MTKDEEAWVRAITRLGCIVCIEHLGIYGTPPDVHHMLRGGRRMGHKYTLPICPPHHRGGVKGVVAREQCQRRFEAEYGTEAELHAKTEALVIARGLYRPRAAA